MDVFRACCFTSVLLLGSTMQSPWFSANITEFTPPRIFPEEEEHILSPSDNFTLRCEGNEPVTWKPPNNRPNSPYDDTEPKYSTITIISSKAVDSEYIYESILTIQNVSYLDVGFYYCLGKTADLEDLSRVPNIYIYVDDPGQLSVSPKEPDVMSVLQYSQVILPCRPTSPMVRVELQQTQSQELIPLDIPDHFDRRRGFVINQFSYAGGFYYACHYYRNDSTTMSEMFIYVPPIPRLEDLSHGHTVAGEALKLKCTVRSPSPNYKMEWIVPDQNGLTNGRIRISKTKTILHVTHYQELTINETTLKDQGKYVCVIKDGYSKGNDTMRAQFIRIYDKGEHFINLTKENELHEISVRAGHPTVQWKVDVKAHPLPKLTWYNQEGKEIPITWSDNNNQLKYIVRTNGSTETMLVINNITFQDRGIYQLQVQNEYEEKIVHLYLNVTGKPTVQIRTVNFHLVNESSSVECLATAYPEPTIYWFYKNCQDDSCDYVLYPPLKIEIGISSKSYLNITANQSGYVMCIANNSLGMDKSVMGFFVTDVNNGFGVWGLDKDTIYEKDGSSQLLIQVGETITLHCAASRHSYTNSLRWLKFDDYGMIAVEDNDHYTTERSSTKLSHTTTLLIHNASFEDSANYTCQAQKSDISRAGVDRFHLRNIAVTVKDPELPIITKTNLNNTEYLIDYPDRLQLWCYARGVPKPTITWYKDGEEVLETAAKEKIRLKENNQQLIVERTKPDDEGSYTCRASNKIGMVAKQIKLLVNNKPGISYKYVLFIILAMAILFIPISLYLFLRFRKERDLRRALKKADLENFENGALESLNPELGIGDQADLLPYDNKLEFPKEKLKMGKKLGSGAFGVVMKAEAVGLTTGEESPTVAVKMARRSKDYTCIKTLALELKIMVHLGKHLNVVNLLGACTKKIGRGELLVIVEYCRYGNLHNYLLRHREGFIHQIDPKTGKLDYSIGAEIVEGPFDVKSNDNSLPTRGSSGDNKGDVKSICTKDLVIWAFQVARGMEYLGSRKVLHGDLAARNILLADYNVVKICDFGLAKTLYKNDNYRKKKDDLLPVKWMAVESIRDRVFSTQSDIWSYGIVLWEFFSLGRTPYPGMEADEELCNKLLDGYRMESPEFATNEIYKMMCECWNPKPLCRPSFSKLVDTIGCMLGRSAKQHYVDLNDPYLKINTQRLEDGHSDLMAMLNSPDFGHRSSPHSYVNADAVHNANPNFTENPVYFNTKSLHTFSPGIDVENSNRTHKNSSKKIPSRIKSLPILLAQSESDIIPLDNAPLFYKSISYVPKKEDQRK